jgi:cell division protein FtsI/penicillin-binding protein 2
MTRQALPLEFPAPDTDGQTRLQSGTSPARELTLDARIQEGLNGFLRANQSPLATAVIVDIATGEIRAMVQGRPMRDETHELNAALWAHFPAASLFKTIVAAAAMETSLMDEDRPLRMEGGCNDIHPTGVWTELSEREQRLGMTMRSAYGRSCNGYFANLIVNNVGLGTVTTLARKFGWGRPIEADFEVEPSALTTPDPRGASTLAVGRFGAGFGLVGISAVHAAWIATALANDGVPKALRIFKDSPVSPDDPSRRLVSEDTAARLRSIMSASVHGGTAATAFRAERYREVRDLAGGKTGTLTGHAPKALITLFLGLMPVDKPEVAVATIVAMDGPWRVKAAQLAAESFRLWQESKRPVETTPALAVKVESEATNASH